MAENVRAFVGGVAERLAGAPAFPRPATSCQVVLVAMSTAVVRRLSPLRALVESSSWSEVAMVARSIFELDIGASYIASASTEESERRARRFVHYEAVQRTASLQKAAKDLGIDPSSTAGPEAARLERANAAAVSEFEDIVKNIGRGWSGIGIAGMAREISEGASRRHLEIVYRHLYSACCDYAHPSPLGIRHAWPDQSYDWAETITTEVPAYAAKSAHRIHVLASVSFGEVTTPSIKDLEERFLV